MPEVQPTDFELELLKVLWDHGPTTARRVLEEIEPTRQVGYTTILKMLQVMEKKELVTVDRSSRSHVYQAAHEREKTMSQLVGRFLEKTFDGQTNELILHLTDGDLDEDTLDALELRIKKLRAQEKKS